MALRAKMMRKIGKAERACSLQPAAIRSAASRVLRSQAGFSMVELMVTVVFVTLGSLLVQGSFLRSADMFGRYSNTLNIMNWMNQECTKTREILLYSKEEELESESGAVTISGKSFSWTRRVQSMETPNLSSIHYSAQWTESGKPMELQSELYVYKKDALQTVA